MDRPLQSLCLDDAAPENWTRWFQEGFSFRASPIGPQIFTAAADQIELTMSAALPKYLSSAMDSFPYRH